MLGSFSAAQAFLVTARGDCALVVVVGFSLWLTTGSRATGLSSCSMWAQELWLTGSVALRYEILVDRALNPRPGKQADSYPREVLFIPSDTTDH